MADALDTATPASATTAPERPANFFDRYDAESDAGDPGLLERARLNAKHSYYRGTLAGASDLAGMAHVYQMDDKDATPEQKQYRKEVRDKYDAVVGDLARYDLIRPWGTTAEAAAALGGQIAGGAASPESLLGAGAKGATVLARTATAALQQGAITAATDPVVQGLDILGGVQSHYDPMQTATAFGVGAIIGGGLHIGGELVSSAHIKKTTAELGRDDPQFRAPDDVIEPAPPVTIEQPKEPAPAPAPMATGPTLIGEAAPNMQPHRVATADGKSVDVAPIVVEASDLKASTDAGYDTSLQPRDRDRAASQAQIKDISNNLDPARLGISAEADRGAAIVGPDGMVESGNGRVMAIRDAYAQGGEAAQRYRDWLSAQGIDVSKFKEPVLVRQRLTEMTPEERQAFTVSANQSATLTMSAPERAMADARLLGPDSLDMIRNPDDLGAIANRDFVRNFVSKLPQTEQGAMVDAHGALSAEGLARVRNSVLARAYGNAHVLTRISEATNDEIKSISNALVSASPHWARLRSEIEAGRVRPDIDLTPELLEAVSRTADLRAKGGKLDSFLAQQDAFDRLPEAVEGFMRMFYDPKGRRAAAAQRISDGLKFYAEEGAKVSADGGLDLGMVPVTARDIQKLAAEKGAKYVGTEQGGLFESGGAGNGKGAAAGGGEVPGQGTFGERGRSGKPGNGSDQGGQAGLGFSELVPPTPRTPEQQALIAKRDAISGELAAMPEGGNLDIAKRQGGKGTLPMEKQRPAAGVEGDDSLTGTAVATVPKSPQQDAAIKSLQQQSVALAEALDIPLRQGRIKNKNALGTFNTGSGVVRVREVPDFEAVAHEAGHAIEYKIGKELTDLTNKFGAELAPMVSNPAAYEPSMHVKEGFAEFIRRYIGNPAHAEQVAPGFTIAFRDFMGKKAPEMLKAIDDASAHYRAYLEAPSVDAVGAVVRSRSEEAHGWKKVVQDLKEDGFAATVKTVVQNVYKGLFDDKAPVARAVRELAKAALDYKPAGSLIDLKAADNPEVLMRLFARSHQAAVRDMMDGVRGYHSIDPAGPSLSDALAHATGSPTVWGKWDPDKKALFSDFMVARRAALLWDKFKAGDLANPPVAFSKADAVVAMAELEKANPRFREASNMVHQWTRELLRKQFEGGLIPADLFNKLSKEEFYVPFMRDLSDKPNAGGEGRTGSADGPGMTDTIKRMKGSSRDIKDPLESLMTQAFLVNRTLAHNDIIKSFVRLAEQAGTEGGKFVEKIPAHEGRGYNFDMAQAIDRLAKERGINPDDAKVLTSALTDVFGEDPIVGSFFRMEPAGKRGEPIVFYKEGGQMKAARFMSGQEGHALYETLTQLPAPLTDAWSQMVAATTSTLRAGITTNPMFALTNYIRDQFAVAILRNDYVPIVSGIKGVVQEFKQGQSAVLYGYGGGVSGGASIAPLEKAIESDVNALAKKGYLVNRLTSFKGALELAAFTEAGTRNSVFGKVFEAKKAQGLNDYEAMIEAAFSAQDILDFSRHGSHTLMIRKYIPFINAWVQGLDKARRVMAEPIIQKMRGDQVFASDPQNFNNAMLAVTKLFGVGGVLGAGWAALNADKEAYRDVSPQIKGTHVVIPVGNRVMLVPKPFELGLGFTAGEYAYQKWAQNDPRAADQFASAAWDSLTSGNPITDIPIVKQYFELKSGKSLFTGKDIIPANLQRLAPEQQYTNNTSSLAKQLGKVTGISPIKIDYAVGSTFGLWGKDIMALSSGVDPDAPAQAWEDRVFLRRLLKDPSRTSDVTTKFWGFMGQTTGKYNQDVATYDDMVKKFQDSEAKDFVSKLPESERAFVIMKSGANEDGKAAFKADEKRLHPLQRAYDAVNILNGLRRELTDNTFRTYESGAQQKLSPEARRNLIDNVRELAQAEMRNSFVIMKEPGYTGRPLIDVNATMDKIMDIDPAVGVEIVTRYATAKIYKTDAIAKLYQPMTKALLRDGTDADLGSLASDAQAEGYQFDGDRAKKPQKRRLQIQPQAPAQ